MKLVRLYSNLEQYFSSIKFENGLNVVVAEIRLPQNKKKSSHNLGKSTLARILDFCLLGRCDKNHFLKKREDLFKDFVFFLEIELFDGSFLTIRRSVAKNSKISFFHSESTNTDLSTILDQEWTHNDLPLNKAKNLLDGYLNFTNIKPWKYRNILAYFLRTQSDYDDVFKLQRHGGGDADWKPILAQVLGLDASLFKQHYSLKAEIDKKNAELNAFENQSGATIEQLEQADALIQLKRNEALQLQQELDEFDFGEFDAELTTELVNEIDAKIGSLNEYRYELKYTIKQIKLSLEEGKILFDPKKAEQLFSEAGVLFPEQIKTDFNQLIAFNKAITNERRQYLSNELSDYKIELNKIIDELKELNIKRKSALSFLRCEDVFEKYKSMSSEAAKLNADIEILVRQQDFLTSIQDRKEELRRLRSEYSQQKSAAERHVRNIRLDQNSLLAKTSNHFSAIIDAVLGKKALLNVKANDEGNLDFTADFVDSNEISTSEAEGTSYRKLMCVAFDLAILRAHLQNNFPRFVYHDGIFETLDPRKKEKLLEIIREYNEYGIQSTITLISSDLPNTNNDENNIFDESEVLIRLHDDGTDGRLFKFDRW